MTVPIRYARFSMFLQQTGKRAGEIGFEVGSATKATGGTAARRDTCWGEGIPILHSRLLCVVNKKTPHRDSNPLCTTESLALNQLHQRAH